MIGVGRIDEAKEQGKEQKQAKRRVRFRVVLFRTSFVHIL